MADIVGSGALPGRTRICTREIVKQGLNWAVARLCYPLGGLETLVGQRRGCIVTGNLTPNLLATASFDGQGLALLMLMQDNGFSASWERLLCGNGVGKTQSPEPVPRQDPDFDTTGLFAAHWLTSYRQGW